MIKTGKALAGMAMAGAVMSGLLLAAAPASAAAERDATWSCTGIPDDSVSLEIDPDHCDGGRGDLVTRPVPGMWICGWGRDALFNYVLWSQQPNAPKCAGGTSYLIMLGV